MKKKLISAAFVAISCLPAVGEEPAKITFDDHVKPILREHCTSCHNANDKKSGLALDTYQAVMAGGSGGDAVVAGDLDSSRLYALAAHKEQPYMPPNQDMIPQAKVDLLKTWIEQGMPENSGSEIKKPKANAMAIANRSPRRCPAHAYDDAEANSFFHASGCNDCSDCGQSMVTADRCWRTNAGLVLS